MAGVQQAPREPGSAVAVEAGSSATQRPSQAAACSILNSKAFFFFLSPIKNLGNAILKRITVAYPNISKWTLGCPSFLCMGHRRGGGGAAV